MSTLVGFQRHPSAIARTRTHLGATAIALLIATAPAHGATSKSSVSTDVFPPNCVFPAGWTHFNPPPTPPSTAWTVATDQAFEGTCPLKTTLTDMGDAGLRYTGDFLDGTI